MGTTSRTEIAAQICGHRPLPGASTIGEILSAAGLHPEEMVAEILCAHEKANPITVILPVAPSVVIGGRPYRQDWECKSCSRTVNAGATVQVTCDGSFIHSCGGALTATPF